MDHLAGFEELCFFIIIDFWIIHDYVIKNMKTDVLASSMCLALILIYAQVMMKTGCPFGGESPRLFLPPPRLSGFQFCQAAVTQLPLCILSYPDNGVVNRRMSGSQPEIDFGSAQSRKGA